MGSVPATLALVLLLLTGMLTVGTSLTIQGFSDLLRRPLAFVIAAAVNVVVVPGLAVLLINALELDAPSATDCCSPPPHPAAAPAHCSPTTPAATWPSG